MRFKSLACLVSLLIAQAPISNISYQSELPSYNNVQDNSSESSGRDYNTCELIPGRVRLVTGLKRTAYC